MLLCRALALSLGLVVLAAAAAAQAPVFTTRPLSRHVVVGQPATFTAAATAAGAVTYQWRHNNRAIPGATQAALSLPAAGWSDGGYYEIVATAGGVEAASLFYVNPVTEPVERPLLLGWGLPDVPVPADLGSVAQLAIGYGHGIAVRSDGTAAGWGGPTFYRPGVLPDGLSEIVTAATSSTHTILLRADGVSSVHGREVDANRWGVPAGMGRVVAVAAGPNHDLFLRADGSVVYYLGTDIAPSAPPVAVVDAVAVACGENHSLVLQADGIVVSWSRQALGALEVPSGLSNVVGIAAGAYHSLALRADGTVAAWGRNYYGECNVPAGLTNVVQISAGSEHSVARRADGSVVAWGRAHDGQIQVPANLPTAAYVGGGIRETVALVSGRAPAFTTVPVSVSAARNDRVVLSAAVAGYPAPTLQWRRNGENLAGATGTTHVMEYVQPGDAGSYDVVAVNTLGQTVSSAATVTVTLVPVVTVPRRPGAVPVGGALNLAVNASGTGVLRYQWNKDGTALVGATTAQFALAATTAADQGWYECTVTDDLGSASTRFPVVVVPDDTRLIGWSQNGFGELNGLGSVPPGVVAVSVGNYRGLALRRDGAVQGWGVGYDSNGSRGIPSGLGSVVAVAAGWDTDLALRADGTVAEWGKGIEAVWLPAGLTDVVAIECGQGFNAALKSDGTVVVWTTNPGNAAPVVPAGVGRIVAMAASSGELLLLRDDGSLVGLRKTGLSPYVVPAGLRGVVAIAPYAALRADGTVVTWDSAGTATEVGGGFLAVTRGHALRQTGSIHQFIPLTWPQVGLPGELRHVAGVSAGRYGTGYDVMSVAMVSPRPPRILQQPVTPAVMLGGTATLSVVAEGGPLYYMWTQNGSSSDSSGRLSGRGTATLTISQVQLSDVAEYQVQVSGPFGKVWSDPVTITGLAPRPVITAQTPSVTPPAGQPLTLSVTATGAGPLGYQWRRNGFEIPGATGASLALGAAGAGLNAVYDVRINDGLSVTYSQPSRVTVAPSAYPQVELADETFTASIEKGGGTAAGSRRGAGNKILLYGAFSRVNARAAWNLVRLHPEGNPDVDFRAAISDGTIYAAVEQSDGRVLIGGTFTAVGGQPRPGLARLLADGSLDTSFVPDAAYAPVYALAALPDGRVMAGGGFSGRLARLSSAGVRDTTFAPAPNGSVFALLAESGGAVVVGGAFEQIAGQARGRLARIRADGTLDPAYATGAGCSGPVYALVAYPGGRTLVAGSFAQYSGSAVGNMVRLLGNGYFDPTWAAGNTASSAVYAADVLADGQILIGGVFSVVQGNTRRAVARLQADGRIDTTYRDFAFDYAATLVAGLTDGTVLVGGGFTVTKSQKYWNLVQMVSTGWNVVQGSGGGLLSPGNSVREIAPLSTGEIMFAGDFLASGGDWGQGLGIFSPDLVFRSGPDYQLGASPILDMREHIGGSYFANTSKGFWLEDRWRADLPAFGLNADAATGARERFFETLDGKIVLYGDHTRHESQFAWSVKRFLRSGVADASFYLNANPSGGGFLRGVPLPEGKMLFAGSFTEFGGQPRRRLLRLLRDGSLDPTFTTGTDGTVHALEVLADGRFLIAGDFLFVDGQPRHRVARLRADGTLDPTFVPTFTLNGPVRRLLPQADGRAILLGSFTEVAGLPFVRYLARVDGSGAIDPTFAVAGLTTEPETAIITDGGSLLLGGTDLVVGGVRRLGLLRTRSVAGPWFAVQPQGGDYWGGASVTLRAEVVGGSALAYQWLKDGAPLAGATAPALALPAAEPAQAGTYRLRVTHTGGVAESAAAVLTFTPSAPVLAGGIEGQGGLVKAGTRAPLVAPAVSAGSAPLTYQWSRNGAAIPGATAPHYFPAAWTLADSGTFEVAISNTLGIARRSTSQLTTALPDWEMLTPLWARQSLSGAVVAGGIAFVSGPLGTIWKTPGGAGFLPTRLGVSNRVLTVVHGGGKFVALTTYSGLWTSAEASDWQPAHPPVGADGDHLAAIAYGGGRFVAVGARGVVATSTDGATWVRPARTTTDSLAQVAHGGAGFLALGSQGRVYLSADGTVWRLSATLPPTTSHVAAGAGVYAAATGRGVLVSADGETWQPRSLDGGEGVASLQFIDGTFLLASTALDGRFWSSADGNTWTLMSPGLSLTVPPVGLVRLSDSYLWAGGGTDLRWSWRPGSSAYRSSEVPGEAPGNEVSLAAGGGRIVAVGEGRSLARGPTGGWTTYYTSNLKADSDVAYGADRFVASVASSWVMVSADGNSWSSATVAAGQTFRNVSYTRALFFATGDAGALAFSVNGETWQTSDTGTAARLYKVAGGPSSLVAVGAGGTVLSSADAVTWTVRDPGGVTTTIPDVVYAAGQFVLVSAGGSIRTSPDGVTWTARTNPLAVGLQAVAHGGGHFFALAAAGAGYLVSADGVTWTPGLHGGYGTHVDLAVADNRVVALGTGSRVIAAGLTAPAIAAPPGSTEGFTGGEVTLAASVTGAGPYSFQWYRNGTAVPGATGTALRLTGLRAEDAGAYTVTVTGLTGAVTSAAATLTVTNPLPPEIRRAPRSQAVAEGQFAEFSVLAEGTPSLSYQWKRGGAPLAGETRTALRFAVRPEDAGAYSVEVTNRFGSRTSPEAMLAVLPVGFAATHTLQERGYRGGGQVTLAGSLQYPGTIGAVTWSVLLPAGWTLAGDTGAAGAAVRPAVGTADLLEWKWTAVPASPVAFTYTLNVPVAQTGYVEVVALVATTVAGAPATLLARPDPLVIGPLQHSADTDGNFRISLFELTRVIELFNTRYGGGRTGCYRIDAGGEDGFNPEPTRSGAAAAALERYHSADTSRDGRLSLFELTRVIELFNFRSGAQRTGQYRVQAGTEDGFAPGP
jgi:uncharacterized delta-60 repeat protein